MTTVDLDGVVQRVGALYSDNLQKHGVAPTAVGWRDAESQELRFDKLFEVVAPEDRLAGFTCHDWGCGYGGMLEYLRRRDDARLEHYTGYDISEGMLARAEGLAAADATFQHGSRPDGDADYTFVGGAFNVRFEATDEQWREHVEATLRDLWSTSRRGLAFNLLTTYVDWRAENLFYADPSHFFDFCRRELSRFVTLLHDYPLYEWTILVRRADG